MKILCIYYTGTYNTRYLTKMLTETLAPHGHSVTAVEIAADTPPVSTEGYDLIGFGYPIYGFNSPLPFNRYVQKLRFAAGQRYFIYKNSGETLAMNNASSRILLRRMKRQGAVCVGEYHFVMPYNIHFRFDRDFVREILQKDRKLCEILRYNLENGVVASIPSKRIYNIAAAAVGIQKIAGRSTLSSTASIQRSARSAACASAAVPKRISPCGTGRSNFRTAATCACAAPSFARKTPSTSAFWKVGRSTEITICRHWNKTPRPCRSTSMRTAAVFTAASSAPLPRSTAPTKKFLQAKTKRSKYIRFLNGEVFCRKVRLRRHGGNEYELHAHCHP